MDENNTTLCTTLNIGLLKSKYIYYYRIQDSILTSPLYKHCLFYIKANDKNNKEDDERELKKDFILNKCFDNSMMYIEKYLTIPIDSSKLTSLNINELSVKEGIPTPHFIYAIHVKDMNNVKSIQVFHKDHEAAIFEKHIDDDQEVSIPLATNENIPKEMFIAYPKRISVIPTTRRYDSSCDLYVKLEPKDENIRSNATVYLSIGYFNLNNFNNAYQCIQSPQTGIPIYYVNGKELKASVHDNVTFTSYGVENGRLVEDCTYYISKESVKKPCFVIQYLKKLFGQA